MTAHSALCLDVERLWLAGGRPETKVKCEYIQADMNPLKAYPECGNKQQKSRVCSKITFEERWYYYRSYLLEEGIILKVSKQIWRIILEYFTSISVGSPTWKLYISP